jgi:hypothetical protein
MHDAADERVKESKHGWFRRISSLAKFSDIHASQSFGPSCAQSQSAILPHTSTAELSLVRILVGIGIFRNSNSQGAQEIHVLCCERTRSGNFRSGFFRGWIVSRLRLVQPDGRFQHQHDFKAFGSDISHHSGNLVGFGNAFVDGFAQLFYEIAYLPIQIQPPPRLDGRVFPTILPFPKESNVLQSGCYTFPVWTRFV